MNQFTIVKPKTFRVAAREMQKRGEVSLPILKAGGLDVIDHLKEGLFEPDSLVDIRRLKTGDMEGPGITVNQDAISIDATATLADIANSSSLNRSAPALVQSAANSATPQVRNVASIAGNLLQRPRCWYYRKSQFDCLKKGGTACFAVDGENKYHAIFSRGPCYIVHPSNIAVALYVCDGTVEYLGADKVDDGSMSIRELFHMPGMDVRSEHSLPPGSVITSISLSAAPVSGFYAVKEKQSFDWPLVMAAVALEMTRNVIESARVCAGAVAPIPWVLPHVEKALRGVDVTDNAALDNACASAARGATPLEENEYKTKLLPVAVKRAILKATGRKVEE